MIPRKRSFTNGLTFLLPPPVKMSASEAPAGRSLSLLVLGGTRFIGPEIVKDALARGHTVTLFNRGATDPNAFPDVEQLRGDRDGGLQALRGRKWDAVIDTSGYIPRIVRQTAELLADNVRCDINGVILFIIGYF